MAILKNCEIHFCKLDPKRPSKKMSPKNPTWELQMRTSDPAKKKEWEDMNLNVKIIGTKDEDGIVTPTLTADGKKQWRCNLKKKSLKDEKTKEPANPVEVVNGRNEPVDPNTIGNGSIANIRIFQHEYTFEGKKGIATVLMAVQLTKHKLYTPKPMEEFDDTETEVIAEDEGDDDEGSLGGGTGPSSIAPDANGKVF